MVPRQDSNKLHVAVDFRQLNQFIQTQCFHMLPVSQFRLVIHPQAWLTGLSLKSAYGSVSIHHWFRKLVVQVDEQVLQFSQTFWSEYCSEFLHKLTKVVASVVYLNNRLVQAPFQSKALVSIDTTLHTCSWMGFLVNHPKTGDWLGMSWNTWNSSLCLLRLSTPYLTKTHADLSIKKFFRRTWERVLCSLSFAAELVPLAQFLHCHLTLGDNRYYLPRESGLAGFIPKFP